jgi:Cu(I)/Ag(I) efflux system membrane fusion protein
MRPMLRGVIIATLLVLIGVFGLLYHQRRRNNATNISSGATASSTGMAGMNMNENGSVKLTAQQVAQFGVTFGVVEQRTLTEETRATGVVTFDEAKLAQVAPKIGGFIEHLYVDATGQPVRRGQPLLDLYSPDLVAAQQELLSARQLQRDIGRGAVPGVAGNTTDLLEGAKRRLRLWDISDAQIEDVLRSGQVKHALTLFAPAGGVVIEKKVVQGQSISPGEQLYTIADLSDLWVDVQLREADVASVRQGSSADVELTGLPGRLVKGRVAYVYPVIDSAARTVRARVVVANSSGLLKPGMYASVRLRTPARSALTVPSSAVLRTGDRNVVFVDMGNGELMPHDVEVGRAAGDYVEVLAGVEPGQRVVTSAQFLLDSESNLGEVMKAMMSQMSSGDLSTRKKTVAPSDTGMKDMPGMTMPAKR